MPGTRRSLLVRLLAGAILVALCSTAATAWLAARSTTVAIQQQQGQALADGNKIYDALLDYASTHRDWGDVRPTVDRLSKETSRQIILTTTDHLLIAGPRMPAATDEAVSVNSLAVDPDLGGDSGIDPNAVGPFKLTTQDRARLDILAGKALTCVRGMTGVGVIDRQPNGRPFIVWNSDVLPPRCSRVVDELEAPTRTEARALVALQAFANSCLQARKIPPIKLDLDFGWTLQVAGTGPAPAVIDNQIGEAAKACIAAARRTQLSTYVAPAALLYVTTESSASAVFDLSPANQKRIAWAAAAVLAVTVLITVAGGIRLVQPLRALTRASRQMTDGDDTVRVRVRGSDEIGQLSRAFNELADSRARTEQLRRNMVSDIAHELRTPLSNIRGWLEAVEDGVAEPDASVITSLSEEAALLQHIIDDLRDLATADAGTLRIHPERIHLATLFEQVTTAHRALADGSAVSLTAAAPADLEFDADPVRLRQAIGNLVTNAIRFTPAGGSVTITGHLSSSDTVTIDVTDTGSGISPEDLPKVFDRFWRAEQSRNRHTGGSGLGLAIVRSLAEAHHGTATATSSPTATTFTLTLPITR
ncbi:sensor histidine kinase [Kribbella deserti]|uniref:histidine kinase n=1 Tax=Kribbella deserti TaxID=1926257 RepID=A0ABV6QGM7_9ACTN